MQEIIVCKSNNSYSKRQGKDHSKLIVVGLQSKLADVSKIFQNALEICTQVFYLVFVKFILFGLEYENKT